MYFMQTLTHGHGKTSRIKTRETKEKQEAVRRDWKKQEIKRVSEGKKPYYLKEGDYKKLELVQRYEEIKERGGSVEKFLEKRRKKNAAREHRLMPYERRSAGKE